MLYEYECEKCGHKQERIVKMNEKPKDKCSNPNCKADAKYLKRILSTFPKHVSWTRW